jgi:hypothetical protein
LCVFLTHKSLEPEGDVMGVDHFLPLPTTLTLAVYFLALPPATGHSLLFFCAHLGR